MAAGDDTLGGQDLAVSNGQARTFRFVRSGGFTGTWTAVAGSTLTYDLTVTTDGADRLVVIPAANEALLGKPWRFRRDGVDKVGGTIQVLRPTDTAGDGTVTFTAADEVTITCSVVGTETAAEVSAAAGTPPFLDTTTVAARFDTIMAGVGLSGADVDAAKTIVTTYYVTDADDDVEGRLNNASALLELLMVGSVGQGRRLTTAEGRLDDFDATAAASAVTRWAAANPQTGAYLEVSGGATHASRCFELDETLDFSAGIDVRATVMVPLDGDGEDYFEVLTQTADAGVGAWDAYELAIERDDDGMLRVFQEMTRAGGSAEAPPHARGAGPAAGIPVRIRGTYDPVTGVQSTYVATLDDSDDITTDGERWLLVDSQTLTAGPAALYDSGEVWRIGAGGDVVGQRFRIYDVKAYSGIDGTLAAGLNMAGVTDGAQTVPDLVSGTWDATHGDAEVVVPASSGSGPDLSDATPQAPGTAAAGTSPDASRADHVHPHVFGSLVVPLFVPSGTSGTWQVGTTALDYFSNGGGANGDWVEWANVPLGGTYTIGAAVQRTAASGQFQVSIDGTDVGSLQDAYVTPTAAAVLLSTGVAISPGLHTVRVTINGKNASSSGYALRLGSLAFTRTA